MRIPGGWFPGGVWKSAEGCVKSGEDVCIGLRNRAVESGILRSEAVMVCLSDGLVRRGAGDAWR